MNDMTSTIIAKSDQLNSDDLIGRSITVTVTKVSLLGGDQPVAVGYEGDQNKPWKPCKSMRRVLVGIWGNDANAYVGRRLTLYRDEKVVFGGAAVGGIRISHMSHIEKPVTMALTDKRASRKPFTVNPLVWVAPAVDHDLERLKQEARDAAAGGNKALTDWSLLQTVGNKDKLKPFGAEFRRIADECDAVGAAARAATGGQPGEGE